jgi:hypothetical protein
MAAARIRSRFALLTIGRLLLGGAALFRGIEAFESASSPTSSKLPLLFLPLGLVLLWWGSTGLRAIFSKDPLIQAQMAMDIAELERKAPSGLRPLWIGIAVFVGIVILVIVVASLVSAP